MLRFFLLLAYTVVVASVEIKASGNEAKPLQSFGRVVTPKEERTDPSRFFSYSEIGLAGLHRNDHSLVLEKEVSSKKKRVAAG